MLLNCWNKLLQYTPAAESYLYVVERYATSTHFDEAIEGQFRIGEIYLNGKKLKVLGIPVASALDRAVTIFANVVPHRAVWEIHRTSPVRYWLGA